MIRSVAALAFLAVAPAALAQEVDTAALEGKVSSLEEQFIETKGNVDALRKLRVSGYVQARWEWQESVEYNTTPEAAPSQNGFHVRRGRFKAVYDADRAQYVLQIDATPSGVGIKEGYATIKLPHGFAIDAGLQLFPFGYEVLSRSSADLDTLERAAVTRAFLAGEYDLGVALRGKLSLVNFKVGLFNGNGFDSGQAGRDNDQVKDVIGRATVDLGMVTAGVSGWYGRTINYARADDKEYDRLRYGADVQVFLDLLPIGGTAVKGEYIWGRTTIGTSNANGGAGGNLPALDSGAPVPTGSGWYLMITQNLLDDWQLAGRFESYRRNHTADIGSTSTTVKEQQELQLALHRYVGGNLKVTAAWFRPMNGEKGGAAPSDPEADRFIVQAQAKF